MTNREYLKSCLHTKSHEGDFVNFVLALQIDACATGRNHFTDMVGNIFPVNKFEWSEWLDEEATVTIASVNKMMDDLKGKGYEI